MRDYTPEPDDPTIERRYRQRTSMVTVHYRDSGFSEFTIDASPGIAQHLASIGGQTGSYVFYSDGVARIIPVESVQSITIKGVDEKPA